MRSQQSDLFHHIPFRFYMAICAASGIWAAARGMDVALVAYYGFANMYDGGEDFRHTIFDKSASYKAPLESTVSQLLNEVKTEPNPSRDTKHFWTRFSTNVHHISRSKERILIIFAPLEIFSFKIR